MSALAFSVQFLELQPWLEVLNQDFLLRHSVLPSTDCRGDWTLIRVIEHYSQPTLKRRRKDNRGVENDITSHINKLETADEFGIATQNKFRSTG